MSKRITRVLFEEIEIALTRDGFLKKISSTKKEINGLLRKYEWKSKLSEIVEHENITCLMIFSYCKDLMESFAQEPEPNWQLFIHEYIIKDIYPNKESFIGDALKEKYAKPVYIFLEILRVLLKYEEKRNPTFEGRDLKFLKSDEFKKSEPFSEYEKLKMVSKKLYIYELFKLSREVMPFDVYSHISGVHYIATHCAKQLASFGLPVDVALVSGAAMTHDIGKFGCNKKEESRIPYLHYYYTDVFCKEHGLIHTSHIASNHSTWDLELENLSAESLLLIYSDFRVKSTRENGVEIVHFYTLDESFNVILSKLDNVDEAKEKRYRKVYAKLKDFEDYMISLGVNVDLTQENKILKEQKDVNILNSDEVVQRLKFMAIEHNIGVMKNFNEESSFGSLLEMARGERDWKNLRGYFNIIREYHTYMIKSQKKMTLRFLYEFLDHREGDIRRDAADLMGNIILYFDEEYRKELPEGIVLVKDSEDKYKVWREYLDLIINPGHEKTEQQIRWIGFTLRVLIRRVFNKLDENSDTFLEIFTEFLRDEKYPQLKAFILLEALYYVPYEEASESIKDEIKAFIEKTEKIDNLETQIAIYKITRGERGLVPEAGKTVDIFRENLKFNTPWILKSHNIDVILSRVGDNDSMKLQFATHLSNLLKVCDTVTVRHKAGRALLKIAPSLSSDQINEIVIELTKGLEIGEYEYSKYIPQYLGNMVTYMEKADLEEFTIELERLIENQNERVANVALDTIGYILKTYIDTDERKRDCKIVRKLLGMLLKGLGSFKNQINQEAFLIIGKDIFADKKLPMEYKAEYFHLIGKKIATLVMDKKEDALTFYNNASNLNHIYRFISDYIHMHGCLSVEEKDKIAFFPGSFDPFSLGHKEIAKTIRDMGFDVYLAIDEFSWSKKTQPNRIRRNIARISIADELGIYILPENIPINIANEESLKSIENVLGRDDVYLVVGSDVVKNASSYTNITEDSYISKMNHIVFDRITADNDGSFDVGAVRKDFRGDFVLLSLPPQFEDVSSTRIRENIDFNRDISYLVDKVAQQYIYSMSIYMREPQYKSRMDVEALRVETFKRKKKEFLGEVDNISILYKPEEIDLLKEYSQMKHSRIVAIRDSKKLKRIVALAMGKELITANLYEEFQDLDLIRCIRSKVRGKILVIGNIFVSDDMDKENIYEIILTEMLAEALKDDFTYAIYSPIIKNSKDDKLIRKVLKRSGFSPLEINNNDEDILTVDMTNPVVFIENMNSVLKGPFKKNKALKDTMDKAHGRLKEALQILFPQTLILSINSTIMENKMIKLVKDENPVDKELVKRGKKSIVVPNTTTKALHTDKIFDKTVTTYKIEESNYYPLIDNQVKTLKAFNKPVIILDDLLHKGYRLQKLGPVFKNHDVNIKTIITGILSADGRDLALREGFNVKSTYFLPNLGAWFSETGQYPYIGGDALIENDDNKEEQKKLAINLILPYAAPLFLKGKDRNTLYEFSKICMENSRDIMLEIEKVYQDLYQRKLTLSRLGEVFTKVFIPDGINVDIRTDEKSPSKYIERDLERLYRLKGLLN